MDFPNCFFYRESVSLTGYSLREIGTTKVSWVQVFYIIKCNVFYGPFKQWFLITPIFNQDFFL